MHIMNDIINKVLELMKPYVDNIEQKNNELVLKEQELVLLEKIVSNIGHDSMNVFEHDDSEVFEKLLLEISSNLKEYESNKYILTAKIPEIEKLPQYASAKRYIDNFYRYIKDKFNIVTEEYQNLCDDYQKDELIYMYYKMFKSRNIFVDDALELQTVLECFNMDYDFKIEILTYILKENNKVYSLNNNIDLEESCDVDLIDEILNKNKKLLTKEYNELLNVVAEYVDLTRAIKDSVDERLINKININNILLAKKVWILKKMEFNYYNHQYNKCMLLEKEFEEVTNLYESVKDIKDKKDVIRIIKGEIDNEGRFS